LKISGYATGKQDNRRTWKWMAGIGMG